MNTSTTRIWTIQHDVHAVLALHAAIDLMMMGTAAILMLLKLLLEPAYARLLCIRCEIRV